MWTISQIEMDRDCKKMCRDHLLFQIIQKTINTVYTKVVHFLKFQLKLKPLENTLCVFLTWTSLKK